MSDAPAVYANVPTLSGRAPKKQTQSRVGYGSRFATKPSHGIAALTNAAVATLVTGFVDVDETWLEAQTQWWSSIYESDISRNESLRFSADELKSALPQISHQDLLHDSGLSRVSQSAPYHGELATQGIDVQFGTGQWDEKNKRSLNWAFRVYAKRLRALHLKALRDSTTRLVEQIVDEPSPEAIATNETLGSRVRYDALLDWLSVDRANASQFVLSELNQAKDSWRDALVHAAIDTEYQSSGDRCTLADSLLRIAANRRSDTDSSATSVTRTALLRAGSLLASSEIDRLRPFLNEARSNFVALVAMLRIVTNDPPTDESVDQVELVRELRNIVSHYSHPVTYRRGDIDAALFNALNLLAIYSPKEFGASLDDLRRLSKPYLFAQLHDELVELKSSPNWRDLNESKASQNLVQAIARVS